jgi:hypothetical protein
VCACWWARAERRDREGGGHAPHTTTHVGRAATPSSPASRHPPATRAAHLSPRTALPRTSAFRQRTTSRARCAGTGGRRRRSCQWCPPAQTPEAGVCVGGVVCVRDGAAGSCVSKAHRFDTPCASVGAAAKQRTHATHARTQRTHARTCLLKGKVWLAMGAASSRNVPPNTTPRRVTYSDSGSTALRWRVRRSVCGPTSANGECVRPDGGAREAEVVHTPGRSPVVQERFFEGVELIHWPLVRRHS